MAFFPELGEHEVHIWKTYANEEIAGKPVYNQCLSRDETERAEKFRFEKDRSTYKTARIMLRYLLGAYLRKPPPNIDFLYTDLGKPYVKNSLGISFNVSHSENYVLCGVAKSSFVGVDVEFNKKTIEFEDIASKFFSSQEYDTMMSLPTKERSKAFFNCWTRKEAYVKAKGGGLTIPLDKFGVSILAGHQAKLLWVDDSMDDHIDNWEMASFEFENDFTASAIVNKSNMNFRVFDWEV